MELVNFSFKDAVKTWNKEKLNDLLKPLSYIGVEDVPFDFMQAMMVDNLNLAVALDSGYINDTDIRDEVIDVVSKKIGMSNWPTYGDNKNFEEHYKKFKFLGEKFGLVFEKD